MGEVRVTGAVWPFAAKRRRPKWGATNEVEVSPAPPYRMAFRSVL
jgi:hypothetical protein